MQHKKRGGCWFFFCPLFVVKLSRAIAKLAKKKGGGGGGGGGGAF
eukprot:COSAG06_NODE_53480_length_300_cov_0.208955_1_plen_44_part_10